MAARAEDAGITFVAFTATPKAKTLELFGTRPRPDAPAGAGQPAAGFHVYAMRQAIEEGFILDVLQNYTPYKLAFKLAHEGRSSTSRGRAQRGAEGHHGLGALHPYNIAQKVEIVVEHFRDNVRRCSRARPRPWWWSAAAWRRCAGKLAIDKYIKSRATPSARWWRSRAR
jgi:type I restriction enzyme R subunit